MVRGSISGGDFNFVGDKWGDTRVGLILHVEKNDIFLLKTYNGKREFYNGKWPFSSGKTILFEFRWFLLPAKSVRNRLPKLSFVS